MRGNHLVVMAANKFVIMQRLPNRWKFRGVFEDSRLVNLCYTRIGGEVYDHHGSQSPRQRPVTVIEDVAVTKMLKEAGNLLDIELVDSLIIGCGSSVSLNEKGLRF